MTVFRAVWPQSAGCLQQVKNVMGRVLYIPSFNSIELCNFRLQLKSLCLSLVAQLASVYLWFPQHDMFRSISSPPLGEMSVQSYPRTQQIDLRHPINLEVSTVTIRPLQFPLSYWFHWFLHDEVLCDVYIN